MERAEDSNRLRRKPMRVVLAGVVLAAGMAFPMTNVNAATTTVKAKRNSNGNWAWAPKHVTINRLDRIRWKNPTNKRHNIAAYGSNWSYRKGLPKGGTRKRQFKKRGNFYYRCTLHSAIVDGVCKGQCGIIHVR